MRKRGQAECHQPDPKSRASTDICVQVLDLGIGSQRFRMREKGVKQGRKKTQYKDVLLSDSLLWGKGALPRVLQSCQHRGWKRKACITGFHSPWSKCGPTGIIFSERLDLICTAIEQIPGHLTFQD